MRRCLQATHLAKGLGDPKRSVHVILNAAAGLEGHQGEGQAGQRTRSPFGGIQLHVLIVSGEAEVRGGARNLPEVTQHVRRC